MNLSQDVHRPLVNALLLNGVNNLGLTDRKHDATHHRKICDASMNMGAYIQALFSDFKTFVLRQYALILQPNLIFFYLSPHSLTHSRTHSLFPPLLTRTHRHNKMYDTAVQTLLSHTLTRSLTH